MIRILAIDDHPLLVKDQWEDSNLKNLAILLPLEEVTSLQQASNLVQYYQPDVVLLDFYIGSFNGDEILKNLEAAYPDVMFLGNSSIAGKFTGIVNIDKNGRKLFDVLIPLIRKELEEKKNVRKSKH